MIKNVKKIPKYSNETPATIDPSKLNGVMAGKFSMPSGPFSTGSTSIGTKQSMASMDAHKKAISSPGGGGSAGGGISAGGIAGAVGGVATTIAEAMGIEQTNFSKILGSVGSAVSNLGPVGAVAGGVLQTIGAFSGGGGSVDETTGDYRKSSGLTRVFGWGHSDESIKAKAGRIKASNVAREQTQDIQADYYNNPNIEVQPSVLAAEGGIMRKPVDALVSKGELIYDPETKKLSKVPGSKGKPNKADDVAVKLYEGDVVVSNSPTMLMANGKTPAQNLENMVTIDKKKSNKLSESTVKAREAIIKKVVNWQEANKTKPQEYAMYSNGDDYVDPNLLNWAKQEANKQMSTYKPNTTRMIAPGLVSPKIDPTETIKEVALPGSPISSNIKPYSYNKDMTQFAYWDKEANDYKKEYIDWVNSLTQKDVNDIFSGKYGDMSTYKGINKDYTPTVEEARQLMTDKKYGDWHKMSQSVMGQQKQKFGALKSELPKFGQDTPGIPKLKNPGVLVTADRPKKQRTPINWGKIEDGLYKAASVLTPLLDREKAEKVDYQVPVAKYISTAVNVDPQLRSINDSYAMARYNQANINPNTGAGMAYGLQAAANRAKQMSDVYNWQTNAQNQLIGRNVDTYNRWSENYANIMNNVYDKAAANRAAARNINRQNKATALKNQGSILRNDKQYATDRVRMEALDPMLSYGYQNDAKLREMLNEYLG